MSQITVTNLSKKIKGKTVLDNINFQFQSGMIYGLYGRNGSGKTMLLRAVAGLIYPTTGEIKIDDQILQKDMDFYDSLGIIIENASLLPQFDGFTNLKILGKIKKIASDEDIRETLSKVGLDPNSKKHVSAYSLGMKQKLSIAQALFEKPKLLLLDEPTNALDEDSILKVRELLLECKANGSTILVASHNKDDLRVLADETLHMIDGRLEIPTSDLLA